ncbi:hypothetical protein ACFX13_009894 [Malus domestica]
MQELFGLFPGLVLGLLLGRLLAIVFFLGPLGSLGHLLLLGAGHPVPASDHQSRKHNGMTKHMRRRGDEEYFARRSKCLVIPLCFRLSWSDMGIGWPTPSSSRCSREPRGPRKKTIARRRPRRRPRKRPGKRPRSSCMGWSPWWPRQRSGIVVYKLELFVGTVLMNECHNVGNLFASIQALRRVEWCDHMLEFGWDNI